MRSVRILGIPIHAVTMADALGFAVDCIHNKTPGMIMTPNAEILYLASKRDELRDLLLQSDLRVADGSGLIWAARMHGTVLPERVTGIDLMYNLLDYAAKEKAGVYFLGAKPTVILQAEAAALRQWPGLMIKGIHHGYFSAEDEYAVIEHIRQAEPDILLVGMGAPRQEEWMVRNRSLLQMPLMMGVGGSFDVLSGHLPRAPRWMQNAGLEWLFRLWREPRRFRRVLQLPMFVGAVVREKIMTGRHAGDHE